MSQQYHLKKMIYYLDSYRSSLSIYKKYNMKKISRKFKLDFITIIAIVLSFSHFTYAQGPNAPEAAAFEPVDATDMVNLVTGDLSYVLPLLNVPSPEGGYPIALSYHAGIAMEQEASWVGLGWSLNPGTINRGVNGYPDDWGKTNVSEFFYDAGWTDNYYSFSAGVTLGGGASVGLGLSWGSNQSLGGYVSASIGVGGENSGASIGASIGTNGVSIFGGVAGFNASVGTNGVGIGYGISKDGSNTTVGVSLNYSYNSGLSGGVSVSQENGTFGGKSLANGGVSKVSGIGINFSSQGVSVNAKVNGFGAGISTSSNGVFGGDYDVEVSSSAFFIPVYIFYIGYSHTKVKYSLYKYNNLYTSGILNPIDANELKPYANSSNSSRLLYENNFMDVNVLPKYNDEMEVDELLDNLEQIDANNLVLPNYDNYSVTAQGLSGTLQPYVHSELNLSGRGRGEQNTDHLYAAYLNHSNAEYHSAPSSGINVNRDATKKVNFTFNNAYNSFLRMERSDVLESQFLPSVHSDYIMDYFKTNETNNYYNFNSLTNDYESKKREGNYIETFTNKEIRDSYAGGSVTSISNFVDAKQYNNQNTEINLDRSDTNTFLDDGIGAYKITTPDGRTYHYSLPVYNFETYYKNFKNQYNQDENFFEIQKTTPYATHWLLTAITGPDFVDINNNGTPDENDYGYWVALDYGKWSDGYLWQTPNGYFKVDDENSNNKTYSYVWGRKQIYYLDAIKTRTHTALFVKGLRDDNLSSTEPNKWNQKWTSGNFDINIHSKKVSSNGITYGIGTAGSEFYLGSGQHHVVPERYNLGGNNYPSINLSGKKGTAKYIDFLVNKSLGLKKIILLKNADVVNIKDRGSFTNLEKGYILNNSFYSDVSSTVSYGATTYASYYINTLYVNSLDLKEFDIHQHQNILDLEDIEDLGLEGKAQQVIEFNHDYSLAKNSPNSDASDSGRLTLKQVSYKGKQGLQLVPPYKFDYLNSHIQYNKNYIDEWGYYENNPQTWSLNQIQTPTGGKIKINYEADSYYAEAAWSEKKLYSNISEILVNGSLITVSFNNITTSLTNYFKIGRYYKIKYNLVEYIEDYYGNYTSQTDFIEERYKVTGVGYDWITINTNSTNDLHFYDPNGNAACGPYTTGGEEKCVESLKIYGEVYNHTLLDANGKTGGGIRTKSITVSNGISDIAKSEYVYTNPETSKISGITSYAPSDDPKGVPYVSELPPPMVTYEHVKMVNKDGNGALLGSTAYQFGVLEPFHIETGYIYSLGETFKVKENQNTTFENGSVIANKYTLHNCLGNIGRLLSVASYNNKNQMLSSRQNNYKTNLDADGEIGVTQESHKSYKRVLKTTNQNEYFYVSSTSKVNYPSVLESTTNTLGNFTNTTKFSKHDFLTGQVLETVTTDSKNNEFKRELIPAYTVPEYSANLNNYGMGSKVDDITNKNMLTQQAMSKSYIKLNGQWKETGVGITTWNNDWSYPTIDGGTSSPPNDGIGAQLKIWRKHKSFVWDGNLNTDGTLQGFTNPNPNEDDENFVWTVGSDVVQTNSKWKNVSTTTQYDHYSMPLEVKDINDNYASTKMCDDNSKILAVSNAKYTEMYYSGAEYLTSNTSYFDGQVKAPSGRSGAISDAHTGQYVVSVGVNQKAFEVQLPQNLNRTEERAKFKISVWVREGDENKVGIKINNGSSTPFSTDERVKAGDWVMLNDDITIPTNSTNIAITSISGTIQLDDFRLHPIASSMTSYVYNEWNELSYILGVNNLGTRFIYDSAGRLKETRIEVIDQGTTVTGGFKKVSENNYNYKAQ